MKHGLTYTLGLIFLGMVGLAASPADADTVAAGPYYATPSWDQTLPASTRFIVLSNMNSQAVLDRETGLVWQRSPSTSPVDLANAIYYCASDTIGGRQGWRLPRADELMSLGDSTNNSASAPHLPVGHPFLNVSAFEPYWVIDHQPAEFPDAGMVVSFNDLSSPGAALFDSQAFTTALLRWCVRGSAGAPTR